MPWSEDTYSAHLWCMQDNHRHDVITAASKDMA
jgi:hypothetical protein